VACRTVLSYRHVLPQHRSAHLRMTAEAGLGYRTADPQRLDVADRAVRVVARRARELAFPYRHVRDSALGFGDLQTMAGGAQLRFSRRDQLARQRFRVVHAVARRARQVPALVHAAFEGRMRAAVVAGQTGLIDLSGYDLGELADVTFRLVVHVRLPWPMAALAAFGCL